MEAETNDKNKQDQDAPEEEEDDWTYCNACKRSFENEQSFYKHLRGMAHINNSMNAERKEEKKEARTKEDIKIEKTVDDRNKQNQDVSEEEEDDWTYCKPCKTSFDNEQSFYKHLRGMAHINNSMNAESKEEKREERTKDMPKPLSTPIPPAPKKGILKSCLKKSGTAADPSNNGTSGSNEKGWECCSVCDLRFNTEDEYHVHVKSPSHIDKAGEKPSNGNMEKHTSKRKHKESGMAHCDFCDISMLPDRIEDHKKGKLHQLKLQNRKREEEEARKIIPVRKEGAIPNEFGMAAQFRCETCGVNCNSAQAYELHLGGTKHMKKLKSLEATESLTKSLEAHSAGVISLITRDTGCISVWQKEMDKMKEPCIGLDYIEENIRRGGTGKEESIMKCLVCEVTMSRQLVKSHVLGARHRRKYMDKYYPELCERVRDKGYSGCKKSEQTKMTESYAKEIEEREGRGKIRVREIIGEKFDELVLISKRNADTDDRSDDRSRERSSERDRDRRERSHDRDRRERSRDQERSSERDIDRGDRYYERDRRGRDRDPLERSRRDRDPYGREPRDHYGRGSGRDAFDPYASDPYARVPGDPYLPRRPYDYLPGMPPVYPPGMPPYDPYSGWGRLGQTVPPGIRPADLERLQRFEKLEKKVTMDYSHQKPTEPKLMQGEDAIEAYLDDFNKKKDGDDGTALTKKGISAMEEAKNAQDAATAVISDAPNIPTIAKEFISSLRTCLIKNDHEADIANQVSISLTRALFNYRIDENENQVGYEERLKERIAGLVQEASVLKRNIKIPKAILEAAANANANSLLASIPGLDVPSSSGSTIGKQFEGYTLDDLPKLTSGHLTENRSSGGLSALQAYSDTSSPPRHSLERGSYPRQYSDDRRRSPSPPRGRNDGRYSYGRYEGMHDSRPPYSRSPPRRRTPPKAFQRSRSRSPHRKMSRRSRSPYSRSRRSRSPHSRSRRSRSPHSRSRRSRSPYSKRRRSRSPYSRSRDSYDRPRGSHRPHVKIGRRSPPPRTLPYPVRYKRSRSKSRSRSRSPSVHLVRSSSSSTSLSSKSRSRSRSRSKSKIKT